MTAALLLLLQSDARIQELVQKLEDESIDVRDEAARELALCGRNAIPHLRKLLERGDDEAKSRARQIIAEIEKRTKLESVMRPAGRVTLRFEKTPLREALERLAKESGNDIDAGRVPAEAVVTFACEQAGFWDALDGICRAQGGVDWTVRNAVVVYPAPYVARPRMVRGPFVVRLRGARVSEVTRIGDHGYSSTTVELDLAWEKGNRPIRLTLTPLEFRDDKGKDLLNPERVGGGFVTIADRSVQAPLSIVQDRLPEAEASKIAVVRGEIAVDFPVTWSTLSFQNPLEKVDTVQKYDDTLSVTLRKFERQGSTVICELSIPHGSRHRQIDVQQFEVVDDKGNAHKLDYTGSYSDGRTMVYQLFAFVPESAGVREVRHRTPKEVHTERIALEFRDIPIR